MKQLVSPLWLLTIGVVSCDPPGDSRFWITNASPDSLYYFEAYERFPLPKTNPFKPYDERGFYPLERRNFPLGTGKWDGILTLNSPTDSTLQLYIFRRKIVQTTPWDSIQTKKLYQVYPLKLNQLQRANWKITIH